MPHQERFHSHCHGLAACCKARLRRIPAACSRPLSTFSRKLMWKRRLTATRHSGSIRGLVVQLLTREHASCSSLLLHDMACLAIICASSEGCELLSGLAGAPAAAAVWEEACMLQTRSVLSCDADARRSLSSAWGAPMRCTYRRPSHIRAGQPSIRRGTQEPL